MGSSPKKSGSKGSPNAGIWIIIPVALIGFYLIGGAFGGSSDPNKDAIAQLAQSNPARFTEVEKALEGNSLSNAVILRDYVRQAKAMNPEHGDALDGLAQAASARNRDVQDLIMEHRAVMKDYEARRRPSGEILADLRRIHDAASPEVINAALVDEINTVAALTNNQLQPVDLPPGQSVPTAGAALVGNPHYGSWQQTANGGSVWSWLGPYLLFQNLMGPTRYQDWFYDRPWSYDYDVYRDRYGSNAWRTRESGRLSQNWGGIKNEGERRGRRPSSYTRRQNTSVATPSQPRSSQTRRQSSFSTQREQMIRNGGRRVSSYGRSSSYQQTGRQAGFGNRGFPASSRGRGGFRGK